MLVSLSCPHCGWTYRVPEEALSTEVRCKRCANAFAARPGGSPHDPDRRTAPTADAPPRGRPAWPRVAGGVGLLVLLAGSLVFAGLRYFRAPRGAVSGPAAIVVDGGGGPPAAAGGAPGSANSTAPGPPIPQDPEKQRQSYDELLAFQRRTLAGAYDKVGKKDPRWDGPAREALEGLAGFLSSSPEPRHRALPTCARAREAINAGCDDGLVLYAFARAAVGPAAPPAEEGRRRYEATARALERSGYSPFRKMVGLYKAGLIKAGRRNAGEPERREAARLLDLSLALIPQSAAQDEHHPSVVNGWRDAAAGAVAGFRSLLGDQSAALARVDAALAGSPALEATRLRVRGNALIEYAWEARGTGTAGAVTPEGARLFRERLAEARTALEAAYAAEPDDAFAPTQMLTVVKGLGGGRAELETWFERAMRADGNNARACVGKMDWLDPAWHGSAEEVAAFGRACRATGNWRAGISVMVGGGYLRACQSLPREERDAYMTRPGVWDDIRGAYEEYLGHFPENEAARTEYAGLACLCGQYAEADRQFRELGERLVPSEDFPDVWLKQARAFAARAARGLPAGPPRGPPPPPRLD
jgi:predicted Zn finger-like uncharacterized protein